MAAEAGSADMDFALASSISAHQSDGAENRLPLFPIAL
jgi:hypothetical protein